MVSPRPGTVWVSWSRPQSATTGASASESGERRIRSSSVGCASASRSATSSSSFLSAGEPRFGIQVRIGSSAVARSSRSTSATVASPASAGASSID